ncbi:TetR/AcrR family transcriptional regulator [uncultured Alistipes sp.]|uniref:TetR/AcrR family transcriptional regulator n=1 Tax=uncultured Alistipes sp. TaxID=538949 RepID=UPI0026130B7A|nr:TetR/AcrR family transcriptional regulator [uncultured Alistipes sp.]
MAPPRKERIIDQAMQMFVAQGIKAVRMDDIARQLGVSKRTLYEEFGDKEQLLYLAITRHIEQTEARHTELAAGSADMFEAMFRVLSDMMDNSQTVNRMMDNLRKFHPAVHERIMAEGSERHRQSLRRCLLQGIADGLFIGNIHIELLINSLYQTIASLVLHRDLMVPPELTEREAFMQIVTTFFRGIATPRALTLIDTYAAEHNVGMPHHAAVPAQRAAEAENAPAATARNRDNEENKQIR